MSLPEDWQQQAMRAKAQMERDDPSRVVWGLVLPVAWKTELRPRQVDVRRLLGVKAITFDGKKIERLEPPEPPQGKEDDPWAALRARS